MQNSTVMFAFYIFYLEHCNWANLDQKFKIVSLNEKWYLQSWTKHLQQNREILENRTGQERLYIYFFVFFNCHWPSLIFGQETGHYNHFHNISRFFDVLPNNAQLLLTNMVYTSFLTSCQTTRNLGY